MSDARLCGRVPVALLLALTALGGRAAADPPRAEEDVALRATRSSAWVLAPQDARATLVGTGWVFDVKERLLVTNQHVVGQAVNVNVVFPLYRKGQLLTAKDEYLRHLRVGEFVYRGTVLATDSRRDLALIQLATMPRVTALALAEAGAEKGDRVRLVGNPSDSKELWVADAGTVTRAGPELIIEVNSGLQFKARMLSVDTDTPVRPGFSGGPVVNGRAEVVGVTTILRHTPGAPAGCVDVAEVRTFLAEARRLVDPHTAADFKNAGNYHFDQKRYDRAVEAFTRALKLAPNDPDLYVLRGSAYARKGEADPAFADYGRALQLDPRYAWAYNNRGELERLLHEDDRALADFDRALESNPKYALAYYGRSLVGRARGDLVRAREDYQKALALAPSLADYQPDVPADELRRAAEHVETYLADDTGYVVRVNVKQVLAAPAFAKHYRARAEQALKGQERVQAVLAGLALDPFQDLADLVWAGPSLDARSVPPWRLLVYGRFDPERFRMLAENRYKVVEVPDDLGGHYRLYEYGDGKGQATWSVALVNGTVIVLSPSRAEVVDALAKGAGWRRTTLLQEGVRAGLKRVEAGGSAWVVLEASALGLGEGATLENKYGLQGLVGNLTLTDGAAVELQATAKDEQTAAALAQGLEKDLPGRQKAAAEALARYPEAAPLAELMKALRVTAKGDTVVIKGEISGEGLADSLKKEPH